MVGRMCEKCQRLQVTEQLNIQGWRLWNVCQQCKQELSVCAKCKSKPLEYLEDDGQGGKIQVCGDCHQDEGDSSKCLKCKKKTDEEMSANTFVNGINAGGYCNECYKLAEKDTTCYKCRKNQRSGQKGTKDWNFCAECLKETTNSKKCCSECQKVVRWGNEQGQNFLGWEDEEWKHNEKRLGEEGKYCNWVCLRDASQRDHNDENLCIKCKKNKIGTDTQNLCLECFKKDKPTHDPNKIPNRKPKLGECCENCGASSIVHQTKTSYTWKRIRYTIHKTDFTRSYTCWFGFNCPCAENHRKNNQQTCPQCKKHEFPDMSKGWMLDYEIKMAFCSPKCHVDYRELKWEEAEKLTKIEMFPPALDIEVKPSSSVDWEKEGLKKEVLFLRELVKEMEKKLSKPSNLTPEEKLQSNYLKKLQQKVI